MFAVVNTQRRRAVREAAVDLIAWQDTLASPELTASTEAKNQIKQKIANAKEQLQKNLRRAYQHVLYLSQPTPDTPRTIAEITFDKDAETALNGQTVWAALAEAQKAFQPGKFNAKALLTNLRPQDYNLPLSEIRDQFWQAPRLPLLPGGETDLRNAIYEAIVNGDIQLIEGDGTTVHVDSPSQINFASHGRRLAPTTPCPKCGLKTCDGKCPDPCPRCGSKDCYGTCDQRQTVACPKCGSVNCDGTCGIICASCGKPDCYGTCGAPPPTTQKSAKIVIAHDTTDAVNYDQVAALLEKLFDLLMNHEVAYIQGNIEVVTSGATADSLREAMESVGLIIGVREL